MNKTLTITLASVTLLLLAGGAYTAYLYLKPSAEPISGIVQSDMRNLAEPAELALPEVDLSLSGLTDIEAPDFAALPEMDLGLGTSTDLDIATSLAGSLDLSVAAPEIKVDFTAKDLDISAADLAASAATNAPPAPSTPSGTEGSASAGDSAPPAGATPDAATCAQFAAVPSCGYVPADVRALCEQCK